MKGENPEMNNNNNNKKKKKRKTKIKRFEFREPIGKRNPAQIDEF